MSAHLRILSANPRTLAGIFEQFTGFQRSFPRLRRDLEDAPSRLLPCEAQTRNYRSLATTLVRSKPESLVAIFYQPISEPKSETAGQVNK